jgi:hypothetical protein
MCKQAEVLPADAPPHRHVVQVRVLRKSCQVACGHFHVSNTGSLTCHLSPAGGREDSAPQRPEAGRAKHPSRKAFSLLTMASEIILFPKLLKMPGEQSPAAT